MHLLKKIKDKLYKIKNKSVIGFYKRAYTGKILPKKGKINDLHIFAFANNGLGRQILGLKKYEDLSTNFIKKHAKKDWVSLDIGANIGYFSLLLAKLSPNGEVHSFEPGKLDYSLLNINSAINNFGNIHLNNFALSNENGSSKFIITEDSGFSSFKDTARVKIKETTTVKTMKLDDYVSEKNIDKIDFIKMDIEGAEKMVLEGAENTLKTIKPKIILLEVCKENLLPFNEDGNSVLNYIKQFDYHFFTISKNNLIPFSEENFGKSTDICCVHKDFNIE